jgi:hypothetical protein
MVAGAGFSGHSLRGRELGPGRMLVVPTGQATNPHFIINFPTKRHWRENSRIEDIESGLVSLVHESARHSLDRAHPAVRQVR